MAFVASSRGQVYYWSECDNWRSIPPANRRWFGTTAEAEAGGYRPSTARGCEAPELREGPTPVHTNRCTVIRVIDGDTVVCEEAWERIRLILIDAPETGQGQAATDARVALESLLPLGTIARLELDVQERDSYGRILGYLYTPAGEFVNETLARQGFAVTLVVPPNVRHVDRIRSAVDEARRAGRGLWAGSAFECAPADYRAGRCDR
jgi:micrococcal nuclease